MAHYIFNTPEGKKEFTDIEKAEKFKIKCENKNWNLVAHGGNIYEGFIWVYSD